MKKASLIAIASLLTPLWCIEAASAAPALSPLDQVAVFKAAGFKKMRGHWESGCNDPSAGAPYGPGEISEVKDLNGDGRPEAIITENGSYCYGNTGTAFWLVSKQVSGAWKMMYSEVGMPEFLKTKGIGGWPDISIGGPGFCFPVMRWNGKAYMRHRFAYEGKACRP